MSNAIFSEGLTVLDGGLSTALERRGHDLAHHLWTARCLIEDPEAIVAAHLDYLRAGARVLLTASYQANVEGFRAMGLTDERCRELMLLPTALAREAVRVFSSEGSLQSVRPLQPVEPVQPEPILVGASVGPYGAVLADGSEYRGHYTLTNDQLSEFHHDRMQLLVESAPDFLACETIPSTAEARVIASALDDFDLAAWITFTCSSGSITCAGDRIEDAIAVAASSDRVVAVGINCTAPQHVSELLTRARSVSDLPFVVYANSGQLWDGDRQSWHGATVEIDHAMVDQWIASGACIIGGCCGVGPPAIAALARHIQNPSRESS